MKKFWLIQIDEDGSTKILAEGCILPDGQCAIAWRDKQSHGCYSSFENFKSIQDRQTSREIVFDELWADQYNTDLFSLYWENDVTGISGIREVAAGCKFQDIVVVQWKTATPSTFWYPNIKIVEELFSHGGNTVVLKGEVVKR